MKIFKRKKEKPEIQLSMLWIYPLFVLGTFASFSIIFFNVIPEINRIGFYSFSADEMLFVVYFMLPFTALDILILYGYFVFIKKVFKKIQRHFANQRKEGENNEGKQ